MKVLKYLSHLFLVNTLIVLLLITACSQKQNGALKETHRKDFVDSLPVFSINQNSLKIITPGQNGIPLPKIIKSGELKTLPANENIVAVGAPEIVIMGTPRVFSPGHDTIPFPKAIPAIHRPYRAGIPDVMVVQAPSIRDQNSYNFSTYTKLQGLKHNTVRCISQDKAGNLLFGTAGGISKYDGKYFTHITEKEGLSNNAIISILEDSKGNLWLGSLYGGLLKYDGKFFTKFTEKEGLSSSRIRAILEDRKGNLWFATHGGTIIKYDGVSFINFTKREGIPQYAIMSIIEDHKGNLWFGTWGGGILKYDGEKFMQITEKQGLPNNNVFTIIEDHNGYVWIGTKDGGVSKFDGKTFANLTVKEGLMSNTINTIIEDRSNNLWFGCIGYGLTKFDGKYLTHFTKKEGLPSNFVLKIFEDRSGNVWVGTDGGGVSKYGGGMFTHFTEKEGLSNSSIWSIIKDRKQNIWLGTYGGGVSKYDGKSFSRLTEKEGLSYDRVLAMLEDRVGNMWFGTYGGGVSRYDGKFITQFTKKEGLSGMEIESIIEDHFGNIWFGTYEGGVSKYDGKSFTQFTEKDGLPNSIVIAILEDHDGNLWFGTAGGGAVKYNGKSFTYFTEKEKLSNNKVSAILEDHNGNMWFGTNGGGITILCKESNDTTCGSLEHKKREVVTLTEKDGLSSNYVSSMIFDREGNLLIGTRFGLSKVNAKDVRNIDGLAMRNGNSTTSPFQNFTYEDGFLGIGVNGGIILCEVKNGDIWIGANERLTIYHPEADLHDTIPPNIQLTGIDLFNEPIAWANLTGNNDTIGHSSKSIISKDTSIVLGNGVVVDNFEFNEITPWYGIPKKLSLAYNNNFVTFNFVGITQVQSKKVKYKYKLDGIDKYWSGLTSHTSAPYGNLPHGSYTFRVKAMNGSGYWSKEFTYTFKIRPPWWRTWWFRMLVIIAFIMSLIGLFRWRVASLRMRQLELEAIVEEKTAKVVMQNKELQDLNTDLQNMNEETQTLNEELTATNEVLYIQREKLEETLESLKKTQQQLIQSEKMASIGVLAAGVAHEINNPLNFIQGGILGIEEYFKEHPAESDSEVDLLINGIREGVRRASEIVRGLNHFSRTGETNLEKVNIHAIIENCMLILKSRSDYIEYVKHFTSEPFTLIGNEGRLHQVILNVLTNAIQAIVEKGMITIETKIVGVNIEIAITDTGRGISEENIPRILDPFFTTKDPGEGTGLGLSITYNIVNEHNGKIRARSKLGEGTTITIMLPISK